MKRKPARRYNVMQYLPRYVAPTKRKPATPLGWRVTRYQGWYVPGSSGR